MLIVGAGGLAAQLFQEIEMSALQDIAFWSEIPTKFHFIEEKYPVLKNDEEVKEYFEKVTTSFIVCLGDIETRKKIVQRFVELGGCQVSYITPYAEISPYIGEIGNGSMLLKGIVMEPYVTIGKECLLNRFSQFGHGCKVGDNCEIAPYVVVSADAEVGENSLIGLGAIILPKVKIGKNVIVSAGSVVTKNIKDYAVVSGVPGEVRFYKKEKREQTT